MERPGSSIERVTVSSVEQDGQQGVGLAKHRDFKVASSLVVAWRTMELFSPPVALTRQNSFQDGKMIVADG